MSLTERLQRAKVQRDLAAGRVTSEAALLPEPQVIAEAQGQATDGSYEPFRSDTLQIEVGPIGLASVVDTPRAGPLFGGVAASADAANRCPSCNRVGRVD